MFRLLLVLFACLSFSPCRALQSPDRVQFQTLAAPGQTAPAPTIYAYLYKPAGPGPFPAVVVLHHCGGIDSDLYAWGGRLADLGYVSMLPDSFGSRGVGKVCATGGISPTDRIFDAYATANYLRTLPQVRGDRIGLIGFSHGAGTITELASRPPLSTPFRAAVAYYPECRPYASFINLPTLILIGAKDDWTPAAPCAAWAGRIGNPDKLNVVVYPNAYHKFDGPGARDTQGQHGIMHHLQYDADAAPDANARALAFLARWLK